uniref:Uncharacterized protein n=1 Tax=Chromera velia CCMP2878 TaxID=1169474 RepID=A0A0G4HDK8_9ALVE|eukprot:Cvel_26413.t1-p1 / transcript=Cvel_26413.t1 / gene=Cvel_26413 / organism=Chromera_velia_CCMP2878 / gene_product=hypothetical protein / transcript_product=hypothetical protein / location=Cvel_scaffold3135:6274-7160(-) / protein_length=146 / sequence_SO=supercontig / SO=protein_coding / is_pseudo=false
MHAAACSRAWDADDGIVSTFLKQTQKLNPSPSSAVSEEPTLGSLFVFAPIASGSALASGSGPYLGRPWCIRYKVNTHSTSRCLRQFKCATPGCSAPVGHKTGDCGKSNKELKNLYWPPARGQQGGQGGAMGAGGPIEGAASAALTQ